MGENFESYRLPKTTEPDSSTWETLTHGREFTPNERDALKEQGAHIYNLTPSTIPQQKEALKQISKAPPLDIILEYDFNRYPDIITTPSRKGQVAIFPDERLFISNSFGEPFHAQQEIANQLTYDYRMWTGLQRIAVIIPTAATITELNRQYYYQTGEWLLGQKMAQLARKKQLTARTKQPLISGNDYYLATVRSGSPDFYPNCLFVGEMPSGLSHPYLGVIRLIVPL